MISHGWDTGFEKSGGLPTGAFFFEKIKFQSKDKLIFQSMSLNEFGEVLHTIGCKIPLGTVC